MEVLEENENVETERKKTILKFIKMLIIDSEKFIESYAYKIYEIFPLSMMKKVSKNKFNISVEYKRI